MAERTLIGFEVVAGDLRVHGALEEEPQHRVVGVVGLVEGAV
ncbi:hypothetical protein O983_12025 [Mycobacterium avium 09-5983]|nr:hypothetical protein O984_12835 [Mycobacterium avium 05-4293]ETB24950.1 hypothetical protein O983_12025 [Mycobacterium avium 09-5983]ETB46089.1 hypothetical protein O974_12805 [Mycobacterium avium 11-0986]KDO99363.1 hypothetical protein MAV3388_11780 [Mycobacterium avium subsp. hominissuis 3388]